ncbi:MAG: CHC2 zinc finger domain-containing protein, partial [Pseudomonadota bacterium]
GSVTNDVIVICQLSHRRDNELAVAKMDTQILKNTIDLRRIVEQDLGQAPVRSGKAYLWKCPFHQERKGYSLAVWQDGYRCFGKCDTSGDVFDWLQTYRRLSFADALEALGENAPIQARTSDKEISINSEPPPASWQRSARDIVEQAEANLWSEVGEPARRYLHERGLTNGIIRDARLGYVPGDYRQWKDLSGLNVPCGITIPWFASGALWAVKVRRAAGFPKYVQIAGGSAHGLYGADYLQYHQIALFCEGEFDALLARQEVGDWICPISLGSATIRLTARWHAELSRCHTILVTYDNDEAGANGADTLLSISPRFRRLAVPSGKDITDFYLHGGNIEDWINQLVERKTYG